MTNQTESEAIAVREKVLDATKQGQDATLSAVREATEAYTSALPKVPEWVEAFTSALPKMPDWAEAWAPKLPDLPFPSFEGMIAFTQKVWESQRDFNMKLYEALTPIAASTFDAAKETAKVAKPPTDAAKTEHAKAAAEHAKAAAEHTTRATSPKA
jgi:hypothetical protein